MARTKTNPVIKQVLNEQNQGHETRKKLFNALESKLGKPVVSFFTSFTYPVMIEDTDADMLEGILQTMDLKSGLALFINSPGGYGLTAERIITICRNYSGTKEYIIIVPNKAKSAATMICFGAIKIYMSPTSELGPVDPQLSLPDSTMKRFSAYNVVESYDELFTRAEKTKGNLEPYLQQLQHYDEREIKEFRAAISLSEDISVKTLASGMMKDTSEDDIRKKIKVFLNPKKTKTHGRPISRDEAKTCGLKIEFINVQDDLWKLIYELYIRTDHFVSTKLAKCIENKNASFAVNIKAKE